MYSAIGLPMRALVDYDNVPEPILRQGPLYLADRLFEAVRPHFADDTHFDLKLYGGWYEQDTLTRKAQDLVAQLAGFPYPIWIRERTPLNCCASRLTLHIPSRSFRRS